MEPINQARRLRSLWFEIGHQLLDRFEGGRLELKLGGHFAQGTPPDLCWRLFDPDGGERLLDFWKGQRDSVGEPVRILSGRFNHCHKCGEEVVFHCDGHTIQATECPYPDGFPAIEFDLNVPSGKMVVANDLRRLFPIIGNWEISLSPGMAKCTQAYAKIGLAHGFVGNTGPGVYEVKPQTHFVIGRRPKKNKRVASVCTDLWWYSICDADEYRRRAEEEPKDDVITCTPGVYHFKHLYKEDARTYCHITWVRPPDAVTDLDAEYKALYFTAEEVVGDHIARWRGSVVDAADHLMCVIGNGAKIHPNGWIATTQDIDRSAAISIPEFQGPYLWYPISEYSRIAIGVTGDTRLNASFVSLSFNIVRSMLVYDVLTYHETAEARHDQLQWAWKIYQGLKSKYPEHVPDNCLDLPKPEKTS